MSETPSLTPKQTFPQPINSPEKKAKCSCTLLSKNLVVCIDGTKNQFNVKNSNVVELYSRLEKDKEQLTYYNSGIGTYVEGKASVRQKLTQTLDMMIAFSLQDKITSAYRWLSENYEEGDKIFLFGFSRGAYQVRAIAGMIHLVGLLHKGNDEQIPFAYELYTKSISKSKRDIDPDNDKTHPESQADEADKKLYDHFKDTFSRHVKVHFVGTWDTVSSVGLFKGPSLPETTGGMTHVCAFRHALALDELRVKFLPEYANGGAGPSAKDAKEVGDIKEVWFSGFHSDIGGGNAPNEDRSLFQPALRWMLYEAIQWGLRTRPYEKKWVKTDRMDSMNWFWWILEYIPIPHLTYQIMGSEEPGLGADNNVANTIKWRQHKQQPRQIQKGQKIHETVLNDLRDGYVPSARFYDAELSWLLTSDWKDSVLEVDMYMQAAEILGSLKKEENLSEEQIKRLLELTSSGRFSQNYLLDLWLIDLRKRLSLHHRRALGSRDSAWEPELLLDGARPD
ncbi:hypothetical protein DFH06DRAFT_1002113 [Mycena polygramma]|nr:hypothetical protein DFH06DRAFT_1002113 [Mycena polygramma]